MRSAFGLDRRRTRLRAKFQSAVVREKVAGGRTDGCRIAARSKFSDLVPKSCALHERLSGSYVNNLGLIRPALYCRDP